MNHTDLFLGIDGGGTHTRAALVRRDGALLGMGVAGPSNYQAVGIDQARENIRSAVEEAWERSGARMEPCAAAFLGMAGVVSESDRGTIAAIADELQLARHAAVDHDIRTALAGGLGGRPGIALIAGTGSACYGRGDDELAWRAGGWGHLLDDVGSGYWLGLRGLVAITRAADGRSPATSLTIPLMSALHLRKLLDILRMAGYEGIARTKIAALAPLVIRAAREGDQVAHAIVAEGAAELATMVETVVRSLHWHAPPSVVLIGGLLEDATYADAVRTAIARRAPEARIVSPILPPVLGAALLAMELANVAVDESVIELMRRQNVERFE